MSNILEYIIKIKDQFTPGLLSIKQHAGKAFEGVSQSAKDADKSVGSLYSTILKLGGATAIVAGLKDAMQQAAKMEGVVTAINFATNDKSGGAVSFVKEEANRLGLDAQSALAGYKSLAGGLRSFNMTANQQQNIFTGVSEAVTAMQLSAQDSEGVFLALSQIASKGTVAAEELRGQIGERIPGAFSIAAKSMGVTEQALNDMLKDGAIASKDFLPRFAQELHDTFGGAAVEASRSATANFARLQNSLLYLRVEIGQKLLPVVIPFITNYLIPAVDWVSKNIDVISTLVVTVSSVIGVVKIWTTVQWILNSALWANPIGVVIAAIVALIGIIIHVIKYKEQWIAKLKLLWSVIESFGRTVKLIFQDIWEGVKYWLDKAILKVFEFADIAGQKIANVLEAVGRFATFDIAGGMEAWNRDEKSIYTNQINALDSAHATSEKNTLAGLKNEISKQVMGTTLLFNTPFASQPKNGDKGSPFHFADDNGASAFGLGDDKGSKQRSKLAKAAKPTADSITGGGSRNVYINLGKFMENFNINTTNMKAGADETQRVFEDMFLRLLNSAGAMTN